MGRYPNTPDELSSWVTHFRRYPPDSVLLRRIATEIIELRVLLFNVYRDHEKTSVLTADQIAPDLYDPPDVKQRERDALDQFGAKLFGTM